jgi:hypothetical protein
MFGFSVILMASWEGILSTAALGLGNGGSAGFLYTSLGEMGSMAPTSGKHELCCLVVIQNMSDLVQVVSIIG